MARNNDKEQFMDYETSIRKSNELSMAKLSQGLTLNQMQLLAYAIYCTQKNGNTEFIKADFEKMFNIQRYKTEDAYKDSDKISALRFSTQSLDSKTFGFTPIFSDFQYRHGTVKIEWNPKFIPHILEMKTHYVTTDLTITAKFKSSFSWTLYEYLKALYGNYYENFTKETLLRLFGVENRKTYQSNTGRFKKTVLDVAIAEVNKYTELEVWYKEKKRGRSIIGFELNWSTGKRIQLATEKQSFELLRLVDEVFALWESVQEMKNEENKKEATRLIRKTEGMRKGQVESLTSKEAGLYIPQAKDNLRLIESLLKYDKQPLTAKHVPFYNWLEERD